MNDVRDVKATKKTIKKHALLGENVQFHKAKKKIICVFPIDRLTLKFYRRPKKKFDC
jgi:hypothetical protein